MKKKVMLANYEFMDLENPDPKMFVIDNIAPSLAKLCRFAGQIPIFYSVARHSIFVKRILEAWLCAPELGLEGLMHDRSEAFLGDMHSPLKAMCPEYKRIEAKFDAVSGPVFYLDMSPTAQALVKRADLLALATEKHVLSPNSPQWETLKGIPVLPESFYAMENDWTSEDWRQDYDDFMYVYRSLV